MITAYEWIYFKQTTEYQKCLQILPGISELDLYLVLLAFIIREKIYSNEKKN